MIRTEEGLRRTREAVGNLKRVLESLERDKEKMHPSWYATMREPAEEQLRELQAEIDQYLRSHPTAGSESTPAMSVPT
jgi:chemotaxis regulatin CheY-phosphate phosphatase CheZ